MKTVRFEGYLKDLYPNGIELEANSAAEALTGLQNYPGFRLTDGVKHQVTLPGFQSRDAIYGPTDVAEILVVPAMEGAGGKKGGILQIIIGVILIIAAFALELISFGTATPLGVAMVMAGASMILGGILALLMTAPKATSVVADEKSKYIPANKNTVKTGTPIPILYGRRKVYGHFLSFDVDARAVNDEPLPAPTPTQAIAAKVGPTGALEYWTSVLHPG